MSFAIVVTQIPEIYHVNCDKRETPCNNMRICTSQMDQKYDETNEHTNRYSIVKLIRITLFILLHTSAKITELWGIIEYLADQSISNVDARRRPDVNVELWQITVGYSESTMMCGNDSV